jgi:hypothetical protein
MKQMKRKNRLTLNIATIVNFLVVMCLLFGAAYILNLSNHEEHTLKRNIEFQSRQNARSFLLYLNDRLIQDSESGKLDVSNDRQVEEWASDNIRTVKSNSAIENIAVFKVEYSKPNNEFVGNYLWSAVPTTPVTNLLGYKTTYDLLVVQDKAKEYFADNTSMSSRDLISYNDILESGAKPDDIKEMKEKGIILFKNPDKVQETLDAMYQGSISQGKDDYTWEMTNGKRLFVEWTTVPLEANIGLNGEEKTDRGALNTKYTRIVIAYSINEKYVESPFQDQFNELQDLTKMIHLGVIIFVVLSIGVSFYCTWLIYYNDTNKKT